MRRLVVALFLFSSACASLRIWDEAAQLSASWEGKAAPELEFRTLDGATIRLSELRGRRVLLSFWATWCSACHFEIPELNDAVAGLAPANVAVFGLSAESADEVRGFMAEQPFAYPVGLIPSYGLPPPFGEIPALPATFVIGPNGEFERIHIGYIGERGLRRLLRGSDSN